MLTVGVLSNSLVYAIENIPKELIVYTENRELGQVYYDDYIISAYKVKSSAGLGYCLEINREYPSGERFKLKGDCSELIKNILISGYPNKSAKELNVSTEDEAYFATQIAIWSAVEGYDVSKFSADNPKVIKAIKNIYNSARANTKGIMTYEAKEYFADKDTQDVVMLFKRTEEEKPGEPIPPVVPEEKPSVPEEKPSIPEVKPIPPEEKPTPPLEESKPQPPIETLPQTGVEETYNVAVILGILFSLLGLKLILTKEKN